MTASTCGSSGEGNPLRPLDAREFRRELRARRARILTAQGRHRDALTTMAEARTGATADDEHDPEGGTLSEEWSRLAGLSAQAAAELAAIDGALARLDTGAYGVCEQCGAPIPTERLRARPTATRCVGCAG